MGAGRSRAVSVVSARAFVCGGYAASDRISAPEPRPDIVQQRTSHQTNSTLSWAPNWFPYGCALA